MNRGRIALNLVSGAPEWIELIPAGEVVGRDGRKWRLTDPEAVAAESLDGLRDVPIDYEHASEIRAPKGEAAPAAGWITALEVRGGALWGRVDWTPRGRASVENREYRYISPAFSFEPKTLEIKKLLSVGLTNSPNFRLRALNREDGMDKRILEALGLKEGATDDEVLAAVVLSRSEAKAFNQVGQTVLGLDETAGPEAMATAIKSLKEENQARNQADPNPDLAKFVPRADYDQAIGRLQKAENRIAAIEEDGKEKEIKGLISTALQAGKITPATVEYYTAQCRTEGGVEKFREFLKAAPTIGGPVNLTGDPPNREKPDQAALAMASMFGNTPEDLEKYGGR